MTNFSRHATDKKGAHMSDREHTAKSRRGPIALIAVLVMVASLALGVSSAISAVATVTINPPSEVEYTSAHLSGTVDPGGEAASYGFQYAIEPINEGWTNAPGAFESSVTTPGPVAADLTGLKPSTTYQVRLVAYNASGEATSAEPNPTVVTKAVAVPDVTLDPITTFSGFTAHFSGTVDPNAPAGPLTPDAESAFETHWEFICSPECPGLSGVVPAGSTPQTIAADASRLEANSEYEVKLVATNAGGSSTVAERTFKTLLVAPSVKSAAGASDGKGGYNLEGVINPFGSKVTDCHFNYGPTAAYVFQAACSPTPIGRNEVQEISIYDAFEGNFKLAFRGQTTANIPFDAPPAVVEAALVAISSIGPGGATVSGSPGAYVVHFGGALSELNLAPLQPVPGAPPLDNQIVGGGGGSTANVNTITEGGNNLPIDVEAHVTGLTPGATYHFQLTVTTGGGTVSTGDRIFVPTLSPPQPPCPNDTVRAENNSLALPECRAYEQVTAPDKTGYPALMYGVFGGSALAYQSGAGNINNSGQGFPGQLNRYVADRTAEGWKTIANLNGPGGSLFSGPQAIFGPRSPEAYSEDLQTSFWFIKPGAVSNSERDAYLREADGHFTLIGHAIHGSGANNWFQETGVVGSSSDLSHLVLNGANPPYSPILGPGVYEYVGTGNDMPRRVDLDNANEPVSECPPNGSFPQGAKGDSVSTDGQTIFFTASGGCGAAGPPADEVWARVDGNKSYDASQSHCTRTAGDPGGVCNAPAPAEFVKAAPDGSSVYFTTPQQLVNGDTDQTNDLYRYELPTASNPNPSPALTEASGAATNAGVQQVAAVSNDGSAAYFVASGVLAANEDALGETAVAGDHNLYGWQRSPGNPAGETKFIGRLLTNDLAVPEATPDGRYLVFTTASQLVPTDTDNAADVYRYEFATGTLLRVSTNISGVGGNGDGLNAEIFDTTFFFEFRRRSLHPAVTDNGQAIVFTTSEGLSPLDGNEASDVYLWKEGQVSLISTGSAGVEATLPVIDSSGQDIYFTTAQPLSPSDGDNAKDVYDARVGGGFSFAEVPECAGESCQPTGVGQPASPNPATDRAPAAEATPKLTCPKGKVAKKGVCVKKQAKKHHKKHPKKGHKKGKRAAKKSHGGAK
jgi:hypothetical protein